MKFLCSSCNNLLDVERFRVDGATLVVTCTSCGAENRASPKTVAVSAAAPVAVAAGNVAALRTPTVEAIARAAKSATEHPFDVPPGHCPKCIARRAPGAPACPSCGLTFSETGDNAFAPSVWLEGQWLELLKAWGDDARHEALRAQAMNEGELAHLGRLYRLRLADVPEDPYALRGRDEVLRLAVLPSVSVRQMAQDPQTPLWKYVALSGIIFGCLVALFLLVRQLLAMSP